MIGAKRWIRTAGALMILGGLACGGVVLANIAASSSSSTTVVANTEAQSTEFPSHLAIGVPPSLCADISTAVQSRSALSSLLDSRGLRNKLPKSALDKLGAVGTIRCYSDDLNKRIAVVFDNRSDKSAIVLSSDQNWTTRFPVGDRDTPYDVMTFIGEESHLSDDGSELIDIDSFLERQ